MEEPLGLLGQIYPPLVTSEWMHFAYAIVTFLGLAFLRDGFCDSALRWWDSALGLQIWHLFEHFLLFLQANGGFTLWGAKEPTSLLQLVVPRIELHLFGYAICKGAVKQACQGTRGTARSRLRAISAFEKCRASSSSAGVSVMRMHFEAG